MNADIRKMNPVSQMILSHSLVLSVLLHVMLVAAIAYSLRNPETFTQGEIYLEAVDNLGAGATLAVSKPRIKKEKKKALVSDTPSDVKSASLAQTSSEPNNTGARAPSAGSEGGGSQIYGEATVDVPARVLFVPKLRYPVRALREGIESEVKLTLVVNQEGKVVEVKVAHSAGPEFDESALNAAKVMKFSPAEKSGSPVVVKMFWTCKFRIAA